MATVEKKTRKVVSDLQKVMKAINDRIESGYYYEDDLKVKLSSGKVLYTDISNPKFAFHFYTRWYDEEEERYVRGYVVLCEDAWEDMDQEKVVKYAIDHINSEDYVYVEREKWAEERDRENSRESW